MAVQILKNKLCCDRKTFSRHLVFSISRILAIILLVASQSDYRILNIYNSLYNNGIFPLRWLDTVFKKLSYSLLIAFNFRAVKFK